MSRWSEYGRQKQKAKAGVTKLRVADVFAPAPSPTVRSETAVGKSVKRVLLPVEPPSPVKRARQEAVSRALNQLTDRDFGYEYESALVDIDDDDLPGAVDEKGGRVYQIQEKHVRRRYLSSDEPLKHWTPYRDEYLAELIRAEGRNDVDLTACCMCQASDEEPLYRCLDCVYPDLMCRECCRSIHADRPLDIIEQWNGVFFRRVSLQSLGVVVQLGHRRGETCPNPRTISKFTVLHVNGIHNATLAFCNCPGRHQAGEWRQQLMRRRWYPATHTDPHTAATFEVLNQFHVMTLQGKVCTYDYYNGLEKLRNNAGLVKGNDRFKAFTRMIRQWRHLKMLKRAGRGNDGSRPVDETRSGELVVKCIACPRVGVNLPANWQDVKSDER
ncbi:hypothetical protein VKT23_008434 [Stygiomarasmius scandens]|uniref:CxC2-like cysteine cluster KDZ transposase-associated domain-containing protein n=1 Tax=Marasmiellus scandens TaxID=2682957 RepID=A0ABR1JMJ2_9AGAR